MIANNLSEEEIAGLKEMFKAIDTDNSGQITFEELKDGLHKFGANLNESEIQDLMKAVSNIFLHIRSRCSSESKLVRMSILSVYKLQPRYAFFAKTQADVDNSGTIDYGEFIAAMLHMNKVEKADHLAAAFSYFDKDGSGYITADELQKACEEFGFRDVVLEEMIREADQDNVSNCRHIFFNIKL